jgi:hypothetical protein
LDDSVVSTCDLVIATSQFQPAGPPQPNRVKLANGLHPPPDRFDLAKSLAVDE